MGLLKKLALSAAISTIGFGLYSKPQEFPPKPTPLTFTQTPNITVNQTTNITVDAKMPATTKTPTEKRSYFVGKFTFPAVDTAYAIVGNDIGAAKIQLPDGSIIKGTINQTQRNKKYASFDISKISRKILENSTCAVYDINPDHKEGHNTKGNYIPVAASRLNYLTKYNTVNTSHLEQIVKQKPVETETVKADTPPTPTANLPTIQSTLPTIQSTQPLPVLELAYKAPVTIKLTAPEVTTPKVTTISSPVTQNTAHTAEKTDDYTQNTTSRNPSLIVGIGVESAKQKEISIGYAFKEDNPVYAVKLIGTMGTQEENIEHRTNTTTISTGTYTTDVVTKATINNKGLGAGILFNTPAPSFKFGFRYLHNTQDHTYDASVIEKKTPLGSNVPTITNTFLHKGEGNQSGNTYGLEALLNLSKNFSVTFNVNYTKMKSPDLIIKANNGFPIDHAEKVLLPNSKPITYGVGISYRF